MSPGEITSRQDKRKSRTRSALIQAATELALKDGTNVSIQAITEAADVGFGSFYNHFSSKEELFTAVAHQALAGWETDVRERLNSEADLMQHLANYLRLYVRMNKTHPDLARILNRTAPEMTEYPFEYSTQFQLGLEALAATGQLAIPNVSLCVLAIRSALKQVLAIREKSSKFTDLEADQMVEMMLVMMSVPDKEIKRVMSGQLPAFSK